MEQEISSLNIEKNKALQLAKLGYKYIKDVDGISSQNTLEEESWLSSKNLVKTKTGFEFYEEELSEGCILPLVDELDMHLQNEIVPNSIMELAGLPGSGKTQLCFQFCVSVQFQNICGKENGEAIYISTNKNFSRDRLQEIAKINSDKHIGSAFHKDVDTILKRIYYVEANSHTELLSLLISLDDSLVEKNVRLVVIDSIAYPLRQVDFQDRKFVFTKIFSTLRKLSNLYKFAVIITNDMTTRIRNSETYETPSFGDSFYHSVNSRIILSKDVNGFNAEIVKSIYQEPKKVQFNI